MSKRKSSAFVAAVNDWTLQQLCEWVHAEHGIQVGVSTMWKTLARLGLRLKKVTPCQRASAPGRSAGKSGMAGQPA
jgi:transposase